MAEADEWIYFHPRIVTLQPVIAKALNRSMQFKSITAQADNLVLINSDSPKQNTTSLYGVPTIPDGRISLPTDRSFHQQTVSPLSEDKDKGHNTVIIWREGAYAWDGVEDDSMTDKEIYITVKPGLSKLQKVPRQDGFAIT